MQRLQELRTLVTSAFVQLAITEREQRLIALQERWGGLRQARAAIAAGDYAAAMRTGLVCRKLRTVGGAKNARVVEEYEINTTCATWCPSALPPATSLGYRRSCMQTSRCAIHLVDATPEAETDQMVKV
jgi:hypothetical protein